MQVMTDEILALADQQAFAPRPDAGILSSTWMATLRILPRGITLGKVRNVVR